MNRLKGAPQSNHYVSDQKSETTITQTSEVINSAVSEETPDG